MRVAFQFEENKAQIILTPANGYDATNLDNFQALKAKSVTAKIGSNKELIIEASTITSEPVKVERLPEPNPES